MITLPTYEAPQYPIIMLAPHAIVKMTEIVDFLTWVVEGERLEISNYLPQMDDDPFFLVAATGLGKTVAVPVHVLLRQIQRTGKQQGPTPRVWVIEPRIPIATEQADYMNGLWDTYNLRHSPSHKRKRPLFGCITSASGRINPDAPIQFVTTGIFEIYARENNFDPTNDRVIIDEAHVTVEQNPGVEIGIALCKKTSVTVDYMSATVDVSNLRKDLGIQNIIRADKVRNIIWKSNLLKSLDESVDDLVAGTLVSPRRDSSYFPTGEYRQAKEVIDSALEPGRSHGMLIVVNSYNGHTSDIRKLTNKLRLSHPQVPVLHLASEVIRDSKRQAEFKRQLRDIERRKQNYVIMATSVVEMGITFPTLDYIVTMDSGYDQETIGDTSFPVVAPLGVNSLLQRIGRVGRRRPGIAYISNEVGADYSSLDDVALNGSALSYEPIHYPLRRAPLMPLAYYAVQHDVDDLDQWLAELQLPSKIHEDPDRMEFFHEQLEKLELLGITDGGKLTPLGEAMKQWIGRADIAYATQLQKRFLEDASREEVLFWITATALSTTSASSLKAQYRHFVDYDGSHKEIPNRIDVWSGMLHEDIAVFRVIAQISDLAPRFLWDKSARNELNSSSFNRWSNWAGIDARKFVNAGKAITDTIDLFVKVNGKSAKFSALFGKNNPLNAAKIDWMNVYNTIPTQSISTQLAELAGTTTVTLAYVDALNAYEWTDNKHGHTGLIQQDDTPIKLDKACDYTARITPGRETKADEASWRIASLGVLRLYAAVPQQASSHVPPPPSRSPQVQPETHIKKGLFGRLLDRLFD